MTRRELEITDIKEIERIIAEAKYLHLGLTDGDQPYIIPMNYAYKLEQGQLTFYLHGAATGYKYEVIEKNNKISFSLACGVQPFEGRVACQYGTSYSSVCGKGVVELVDDIEEKKQSLSLLMKCQTGKDFEFTDQLVSIVRVMKITVSSFSAKKRPIPRAMESEYLK